MNFTGRNGISTAVFIACIYNWRIANFQLEVTESDDALLFFFPLSKFTDIKLRTPGVERVRLWNIHSFKRAVRQVRAVITKGL